MMINKLIVLIVMLFPSSFTLAENNSYVEGSTFTSAVEAISVAQEYASETNGIGVVVSPLASGADKEAATAGTQVNFTSYIDATKAAHKYALETGGIAVTVGFGDFDGATPPEVIGDKFTKALERRGQKAAYFVLLAGDPGYTVSFTTKHTEMGPLSIDDARKNIDEVVRQKIITEKILSGEIQ